MPANHVKSETELHVSRQYPWLVGTGPGAGMALMYIGSAVLAIAVCLLAYLSLAIRHVEDERRPVLPPVTRAAAVATD